MKKIYFLLFTLLITMVSFGQTTVFQESFETGTTVGTASETCNDNTSDFFTVTDGTDITNAYSVSGTEGSYYFAAQDTDGTPCTMAVQTLEFTGIDISSYTNMTFAALVAEDDSTDGNEDWDADTFVLFQINIDGAGYTNLFQFAGGGATNTEPGLDTDYDGIADGAALTSVFTEYTTAVGNGTTADIKITFNNLNAGDEDVAIDNLRIIDGFSATPTISIASPSSGAVLSPGTTTVDIIFTTANTTGGETVNLTVNGDPTPDITSPYTIIVADGQTYNVTLELVNTSGTLDTAATNFSVGGLVTVADITALRADVLANGLGRFYEITGASLVSHTDAFQNRKWIEDTNISGVLIYDIAGTIATTYAVGDLVTGLRGTTEEANGVLRFVPSSDAGTIMSSGNTVTPQVITIPDFNASPETYESELISFVNVSFDEGNGTDVFTTGTNYTLNDGTATTIKRTDFFAADYIGELIPDTVLPNVVGVAGEFNGVAQIYVRSLEDLTLSTTTFDAKTSFSVYPNPTNTGFVNITTTANEAINVTVFSILGKQVLSETINNNILNVSTLNAGVYIMTLNQNGATTTKKLVIK